MFTFPKAAGHDGRLGERSAEAPVRRHGVFTTTLLYIFTAGCGETPGEPPPDPPRIESITLSATVVDVEIGGTVAISATVRDQHGNIMNGQSIAWTSEDPSIATVENGTVNGLRPGATKVSAASGNRSASATVTVKSVAVALEPAGGDGQQATVGTFVPDSVRVRAVDQNGNGVPGVGVQFVVVAGGGVVTSPSVTTDASGHAATLWMLGPTPGEQGLEARAPALTGSPMSFTATALSSSIVLLGDTIYGSLSAVPVGEYTFAADAGKEINIFFQQTSGTIDMELYLFDLYGVVGEKRLATVQSSTTSDLHHYHSGKLVLPRTGIYTVRIANTGGPHSGTYRFQVFPIDRAPEILPPAISVGDTIAGEMIFPKGDIDEFTFIATEGQDVNVFFHQLAGTGALELHVYDAYGTPEEYLMGTVWSDRTDDLHHFDSGRLRLPRSGTYTLVVAGWAYGGSTGSYRFQVFPVNRAPESLSGAVLLGDTIDGERIQPKGDVDEFTFSGAAGQDINVFFQHVDGGGSLVVDLYDRYGDAGESLMARVSSDITPDLDTYHSGRLTLPRDGLYTLVVKGSGLGGGGTGGYRFHVAPIDHAPEHVPSHIAFGDTITGERVFPKGDIDRFAFAGTMNQEVALFLQPHGGSGALQLKVIDHSSLSGQQVIASAWASDTSNLEQHGTGYFVLPSTGTYSVVISGYTPDATGSYRLHLRSR